MSGPANPKRNSRRAVTSIPLKRCQSALTRFSTDKSGSIAIIFAMSITLLLAMVGGGVDYARWLSAKSKTLNAMDASVLAGGRILQLPGKSDADAVAAAANITPRISPTISRQIIRHSRSTTTKLLQSPIRL